MHSRLVRPVAESPSRWYFIASAHPPSNSERIQDVRNDFRRSELQRMDLKDMPLCYEHDHSLVLGQIIHSTYGDKLGQIFVGYIDLSKDRARKIYEDKILTGEVAQFSLEHVFSEKIDARGSSSGFKFLTEVSFVKKGNRNNCDLIFGMDDIELKKKEVLKYKFEQLISDISKHRDHSSGISFFEKNRMSAPSNQQAPPAESTPVQNGAPQIPQQQTNPIQQPPADTRQAPEGEVSITKENLAKFAPDDMIQMLLSSSASLSNLQRENEILKQNTKQIEARVDEEIKSRGQQLIQKFSDLLGSNGPERERDSKEFSEIVNRLHSGIGVEQKQDLGKIFTMVASNTADAARLLEQRKKEYENFRTGVQQQPLPPQRIDPDEAVKQNIMRRFGMGVENPRWEPQTNVNSRRTTSYLDANQPPQNRYHPYPERMPQTTNTQSERNPHFIPQRGDPLFEVAASNEAGYVESMVATGGRAVDPMRMIAQMLKTGVPPEQRENGTR